MKLNQGSTGIKTMINDAASRATQVSQIDDAIEKLGISKDQADAIRFIANRVGDQIGQLVATLIEDALLLVLAGK